MTSVCLYFHVHQPRRTRPFTFFSIGPQSEQDLGQYFDDTLNRHYFEKATRQCYLPANAILLNLLESHPEFKISFSITGTFLDQCRRFSPDVFESFQQLVSTGRVDVLGETHYHSLASLYASPEEFFRQVRLHEYALKDAFGKTPRVFRNTEVIYNNRISFLAESRGYRAILAEGIERVLGNRSPNYVYSPPQPARIKLFLRNYRLSDDIGYRFASRSWNEWPLTAEKYASWLSQSVGDTLNLFMDYETFGEHHWKDSGILSFLQHLPPAILQHPHMQFATCSDVARLPSKGEIDCHDAISWADLERDTSAWLGNPLQQACFHELESLAPHVSRLHNPAVENAYGLLQTSDHLYYLCTKSWADGDVHKYFSPYKDATPFDNFISYMNTIQHFKRFVNRLNSNGPVPESNPLSG
ncbi:glycoside hydrolase family 57 protein [Candidatus Micrarchaeota archaeon]|nr:glycoside hydrolase family 57 protein [Candidatus Micrarchaeota archaeon]